MTLGMISSLVGFFTKLAIFSIGQIAQLIFIQFMTIGFGFCLLAIGFEQEFIAV